MRHRLSIDERTGSQQPVAALIDELSIIATDVPTYSASAFRFMPCVSDMLAKFLRSGGESRNAPGITRGQKE